MIDSPSPRRGLGRLAQGNALGLLKSRDPSPGRCPGLTSLAPSGRKTADFAPIAALLLFVAIIATAAGGLHRVQTLREQSRRAQCAGGLKQLRISLTSRVPQVVLIDGNSGSMAMDDPYDDLVAPALIEACLAELEADDA